MLEDGSFLMQHRDDIPQIFFPGKIGLFGGEVEVDESPIEAAIREIREELSVEISAPELVHVLSLDSLANLRFRRRYYFVSHITDEQLKQISLKEGRGIIRILKGDLNMNCLEFVPYDLAFFLEYVGNVNEQ